MAGEKVSARCGTAASSLARDYEALRITRSLYTVLADITVAGAQAGKRKVIPSGFQQAIPGILVMFTLLVLLTSGALMLAAGQFRYE